MVSPSAVLLSDVLPDGEVSRSARIPGVSISTNIVFVLSTLRGVLWPMITDYPTLWASPMYTRIRQFPTVALLGVGNIPLWVYATTPWGSVMNMPFL